MSGSPLAEIDAEECWELLGQHTVGRLVWHSQDGLTAIPLNYAVSEGTVRLHTTAHSAVVRECDDSPVAFEVDDLDRAQHTGWSVLLRGLASVSFPRADSDGDSTTWASGRRPAVVTLDVTHVSGRRIGE